MRGQARRSVPSRLAAVLVVTLALAAMLGAVAGDCARRSAESEVEGAAAPAPATSSLWVPGAVGDDPDALGHPVEPRVGSLAEEGSSRVVWEVELTDAAMELLATYEAQGNCILCQAGYLDLMGRVWSCVVQGDGWVELQVVRALDDGGRSEVTTMHMDAKAWGHELSPLLGEEA